MSIEGFRVFSGIHQDVVLVKVENLVKFEFQKHLVSVIAQYSDISVRELIANS